MSNTNCFYRSPVEPPDLRLGANRQPKDASHLLLASARRRIRRQMRSPIVSTPHSIFPSTT